MTVDRIFRTSHDGGEEHWISVSDLMAGLMIIFLFIAITYIRPILNERDAIKEIAVTWQESEVALYDRLNEEFKDDLPRWNAELERETLTVRFKEPDILFDSGRATLKPEFEHILSDFFPRYLNVLSDFRDDIAEVRIEGHTSSEWMVATSGDEAYFHNMELSQDRTRAVLEYALLLPGSSAQKSWAKKYITANGLSSSRLIFTNDKEDKERSRRVEFRVRTKAKREIVRILEQAE